MSIKEWLEDHKEDMINDIIELCSQPSVSATGEGISDMATLVKQYLERFDFTATIHKTDNHPIVTASWNHRPEDESAKIFLFYNHYDVQPPAPLDEWDSPPFEPSRRNGRLYARGSADNKGNIVTRCWALRAIKELGLKLPVHIKYFVDGEEEIGSPSLGSFIEKSPSSVESDFCVWEFGYIDPEGRPVINLGLKGIFYVTLAVETGSSDCHSANAPIIPNAAWQLTWLLSKLKNSNEEILIPGFYDLMKPVDEETIRAFDKIPFNEEEMKERLGIRKFNLGLTGMELRRRLFLQPSCNICGITTGYQGPGSKTVIPREASVKLDFRLVPGQTNQEVLRLLESYIKDLGLSDIVTIKQHGSTNPSSTPINHPLVWKTYDTAKKIYQKEPVIYPFNPGSGPGHHFPMPTVSIGCGDHLSLAHAPNESIAEDLLVKAAEHVVELIQVL